MALATSNCVINGQKSRGGNTYAASAVYMGYGNGSTHYEYVLSITTGSFTGKSTSITFNVKMGNSQQGATRTYRWALLNSDSSVVGRDTSINLYFDKHVEVEDANQLAQGTITWTDMNKDTHKTLTIETTALKPNTNYFLVLWAYSTNPTSFITVSNTQYHGDIFVEYESSLTLLVEHKTLDDDGTITAFDSNEYSVPVGEYFIPTTTATPPEGYGTEGATYKAWNTSWALLYSGSANTDGFYPDCDMYITIYYIAGGGYVYYNDNGSAVKCQVYYNDNGSAVKCQVYFNDNGVAVKV